MVGGGGGGGGGVWGGLLINECIYSIPTLFDTSYYS